MQKIPEQKWEQIPHDSGTYLSRLNVPGGWLVREISDTDMYHPDRGIFQSGWTSAICFMPDPEHLWLSEPK